MEAMLVRHRHSCSILPVSWSDQAILLLIMSQHDLIAIKQNSHDFCVIALTPSRSIHVTVGPISAEQTSA